MKTIYKNKIGNEISLKGVKEKYFRHWKIKDIASHYDCSLQQIGKIVWKEIPTRREHKYKYEIDHSYFDEIKTEKQAYILGFLCADGCVSKKEHSQLTLVSKDFDIVEKIKSSLQSASPIIKTENKDGIYYHIAFYSKQICRQLTELGCVPQKSQFLKWQIEKIPIDLIQHFIRGYFDGDGHFSFWKYKGKYLKAHFNITSTLLFCKGLSEYIKNKFGFVFYMSQRHKQSTSNNRTIELSGNKQILKIMLWLYENATIYLFRKRSVFEKFVEIYGKRV
jgi:intein-encoded DNA endonuclease-like protein